VAGQIGVPAFSGVLAFLLRFELRMPPAYLRRLAYRIRGRGEVGGQTTGIKWAG
jgi:hypothetical protein